MAISEQQRQKKLAKKKKKRAVVVKKTPPPLPMKKAKLYVNYPIHECLIPNNLFTLGIGELVVTRRISNGNIAMSCFMLDVFCLGVKDALFTVLSESDYEYRIKDDMLTSAGWGYEEIDQSCAKKLLDDLVNYAQELGFSPSLSKH